MSGVLVDKPEPQTKETEVLPLPSSPALFCNCWQTLKDLYYPQLPSGSVMVAQATKQMGDIAVFYYANSRLFHFAKVTGFSTSTFSIDEGNYKSCKHTSRTLPTNEPHLIGFYNIQ